eukprot:3391438-Prorocentrum_lima.AAC.1
MLVSGKVIGDQFGAVGLPCFQVEGGATQPASSITTRGEMATHLEEDDESLPVQQYDSFEG